MNLSTIGCVPAVNDANMMANEDKAALAVLRENSNLIVKKSITSLKETEMKSIFLSFTEMLPSRNIQLVGVSVLWHLSMMACNIC
jgi:hypothetical protein